MALRRDISGAERALQFMSQGWAQIIKLPVTLIFDDTKKNETVDSFRVCSARPVFKTSDAALINWAEKMQHDQAIKTLVFTSDRGLTEELIKNGVQGNVLIVNFY